MDHLTFTKRSSRSSREVPTDKLHNKSYIYISLLPATKSLHLTDQQKKRYQSFALKRLIPH